MKHNVITRKIPEKKKTIIASSSDFRSLIMMLSSYE